MLSRVEFRQSSLGVVVWVELGRVEAVGLRQGRFRSVVVCLVLAVGLCQGKFGSVASR